MMNYFKGVIVCTVLLLFAHCKQAYDPKIEAKNTNLLVVEGFINSAQGPTAIHLSRTGNLADATIKPETNALVRVEGDDGSTFALVEHALGEYSVPQLPLNGNVKYRVYIKTSNGKEYVSDYSAVKYTPAIDSITWQKDDGGLTLYTNSHDPQNATKYYQWKFEETWEIHSAYHTKLEYIRDSRTNKVTDLVYRNPDHSDDTTIYKCWNDAGSSSIILGSTENLISSVVYLPVESIDAGSEKLSVLYSLNLHQYGISHEEYLFLQKMKKNTEQVGTIFDAQPSQLSGNIHSVSNQAEVVIGFVEVSEEQTKRIFIYNNQLNGWGWDPGCLQVEIQNNPDDIEKHGSNLFPTVPATIGLGIVSFYAANKLECIDCTTRGVHQKPDFWP